MHRTLVNHLTLKPSILCLFFFFFFRENGTVRFGADFLFFGFFLFSIFEKGTVFLLFRSFSSVDVSFISFVRPFVSFVS